MDVIDQVMSIFAGIEGYLDDVPIQEVQKLEAEFLKFIRERKSGVREALAREKKLTDPIEADLRAAIVEFKSQWKPCRAPRGREADLSIGQSRIELTDRDTEKRRIAFLFVRSLCLCVSVVHEVFSLEHLPHTMAKARAIVKRRKAVQNIRKITRTMELIATERFRKALDRATEAEAYTRKIAELVADLGRVVGRGLAPAAGGRGSDQAFADAGADEQPRAGRRLQRQRPAGRRMPGCWTTRPSGIETTLEVAGKRGINFFRFRGQPVDATYTQFEDRPQYDEVEELAEKYIRLYIQGEIDRLDVAYTQFISASRQEAAVQTLLPMTTAERRPGGPVGPPGRPAGATAEAPAAPKKAERVPYEFLPDPKSILEEIVPVSFKVRLFKCFLDAAVSEQIARMVAMGGATKNADDMVKGADPPVQPGPPERRSPASSPRSSAPPPPSSEGPKNPSSNAAAPAAVAVAGAIGRTSAGTRPCLGFLRQFFTTNSRFLIIRGWSTPAHLGIFMTTSGRVRRRDR